MLGNALIIVALIMGATISIATGHEDAALGFFVVGVIMAMFGVFSE